MTPLPLSPSAERNKQPILEVLRNILPAQGLALELAAGTGQHTAWFAAGLPDWTWQPTDLDPDSLTAIAGWVQQAGLRNVRPPVLLDVQSPVWPANDRPFADTFDLVFCANMLHIAPWSVCTALMQGAARHLAPLGVLITYGPYLESGVRTSTGNQNFDTTLRAANPAWGLRHLEAVTIEATKSGLVLRQRRVMPSNNLLLVWGRTASGQPVFNHLLD